MATKGEHGPAPPHNKRPIILVYPTVSPESVVIPIVSCILGFPLLALLVICCLRRRAKLARERARRRAGNYDTDHGALSLVRFSPIHRLGLGIAVLRVEQSRGILYNSMLITTTTTANDEDDDDVYLDQSGVHRRSNRVICYISRITAMGSGTAARAVSLHSERAMSRGFPSLELDTVVEERSDPDPEITTTEVLMTPDS